MEELQTIVRRQHGCHATHTQTTRVVEEFRGRLLWEGEVETFDLHGHAEARRCHAWIFEDGAGVRHARAVLELPPVVGPHSAVSCSF